MGRAAAKQARNPRGNGADGLVPTIREFLPWHVLEKKMQARESGQVLRDEDDEAVPDSGVYTSGEHRAANAAEENAPLSFKVYSLAELEARGIASDLSVNATRMSMALMAQKQTPWDDVGRAALHVLRLAKTWALTKGPRPAPKDVFHAPLVALGFELRTALRQVDWKKVGTYAAIAFGTFLVLLFAVVTVADLTDDLKPARVTSRQSGDSYTSAIVAAQRAPAPPPVVTAAPIVVDDLDVEPVVAAEPVAPRPYVAPRRAPAKKKRAPKSPFVP